MSKNKMHVFGARFTVPESDFRMTLKNGFRKCSLFVLSANEWKDQNMDSSFFLQENPNMEKALFDWQNRVAVWRQSEVSIDF